MATNVLQTSRLSEALRDVKQAKKQVEQLENEALTRCCAEVCGG